MGSLVRVFLICLSFTILSACKTSEEKAEDFYQSGLSLFEAGDLDRAAIEFLNVFQHDGLHQDARRQLADIRLIQGNIQEAYSQYLRLIEQYPNTPEVRLILADIALDSNNWEEARRHSGAAIALVPDNPKAKSIATAVAYREVTQASDLVAANEIALQAQAFLDADPNDAVARRVVVDHLLRTENPQDALPEIERALALNPESYPYNTLRLRLLIAAKDMPAIGVQLERMVALFPDDQEHSLSLISWYITQDDLAGAEQYLRGLAGADTDPVEAHMSLVQFLQATQGPELAQKELDRLAAANEGNPNADVYRSVSAVISFEAGDRDTAITVLRDTLSDAEPSEQTWRIRNTLARLLVSADSPNEAKTEVEIVLSQDESNVDALKLRAGWLIAEDRGDEAIFDLRRALGQQPRDAETLTLLAQAHEREGNLALAGERLALALNVSEGASTEAMRYARFLLRDGRTAIARSVLMDTRASNPNDVEVLTTLARVLLDDGAWSEAQDIANKLRSITTPEAQQAATSLQAALLLGQNRVEDSVAFLQSEIEQGNGDITAISQVVWIHIQSGNAGTARAYLDQALADNPTDSTLQMLDASLYAIAGEFDAAEEVYRSLIKEFPQTEAPVLRLYNLLISTNQIAKADEVINAALVAQPTSTNLRWIKAGDLEAKGDINGAISLYEEMYAANSHSVTIANNLASLIAAHKDDTESITRAATIAKRLRELDIPAFQDTYGWIAYRQGDFEEAVKHLEPAAAGLPDDPLVQFHLGMAYAAIGEVEKAKLQLNHSLQVADGNPLPQFDVARNKLNELSQ